MPAGISHWLDFSIEEQEEKIRTLGEPRYRVRQILQWIFHRGVLDFSLMSNIPKKLRTQLADAYCLTSMSLEHVSASNDGTEKYLFRLFDGSFVEAVLIPAEFVDGEPKRRTLCISTQVGCALRCAFCATGTLGIKRNLTAGEILEQFLHVQRRLASRITNVVYMGMGEPLLNFHAVERSLYWFLNPFFPLLGARRITVSTAGVVPKILELATLPHRVKLAISLHATTNQVRSQLMPINQKWGIDAVLAAAERYYRFTRIPVTYEYILFDHLNDFPADARRLAKITRRFPSKVNLIPFHPIDHVPLTGVAAQLRPSAPDRFRRFVELLRSEHVVVKVRSSSGKEIRAACGQLALAVVPDSAGSTLSAVLGPTTS